MNRRDFLQLAAAIAVAVPVIAEGISDAVADPPPPTTWWLGCDCGYGGDVTTVSLWHLLPDGSLMNDGEAVLTDEEIEDSSFWQRYARELRDVHKQGQGVIALTEEDGRVLRSRLYLSRYLCEEAGPQIEESVTHALLYGSSWTKVSYKGHGQIAWSIIDDPFNW